MIDKSLDKRLDDIYDKIDELMHKGNFNECERVLWDIDVDKENIDVLLTHLTVTLPIKNQIPFRNTFYNEVEETLKKRKDYNQEILSGLK